MNGQTLSKRERQIMDVIFRAGEASAADVHQQMPDPPSYTAVRTMLRLLEDKGIVQHRQQGRRYIYSACKSAKSEGRSALTRVLDVFFGGSLEDAMAAHLSDPKLKLDDDDLERLREVIEQAKPAKKKKRSTKPRGKKS